MTPARFYTVSDDRFFPGTAAMLNSLRLTGHGHELVVLDRGLTGHQRAALALHATIVELPRGQTAHPVALKPYPAQLDVDGVVAIIDSDMIVTSSLEPILARGAEGRICVFPDHPWVQARWFQEWRELFALERVPRRQTYVNSGFVALSTQHWPWLLGRWWKACERIDRERVFAGDVATEPLYAGDQDALNAILMSEVPADAIEVLPAYAHHTQRVVVKDVSRLVCTYRGRQQPLLHEGLRPKIWEPHGWRRSRPNAYARLLPRVLFERDVAVRLDPAEVPLWLRPGTLPRMVLVLLGVLTNVRRAAARLRLAPRRALRETRQLLARLRGLGR